MGAGIAVFSFQVGASEARYDKDRDIGSKLSEYATMEAKKRYPVPIALNSYSKACILFVTNSIILLTFTGIYGLILFRAMV